MCAFTIPTSANTALVRADRRRGSGERRTAFLGIAGNLPSDIRRFAANRMAPAKVDSKHLGRSAQRGYRMRQERSAATIRATGRGRTEAIAVHCHHAVMLAVAAATCGQRLLCLQEGQRKRSHQQNEQQAGKRPAHGKQVYYTESRRSRTVFAGPSGTARCWRNPERSEELLMADWSGRADLNCRPLAPQASALPG